MSAIYWIDADGTVKREGWALPVQPTLEKMQKYVGGYVERVTVLFDGNVCDMVVNEEGLIKELPLNWKATCLYAANSIVNMGQIPPTPICGNAILLVGTRLD